MPLDEAHTFWHDLTGVRMGSERLHTRTQQAAPGLTIGEVAPSRAQIKERLAAVAAGPGRWPVVVLGMDGACVPTRPESARGPRPGPREQRAKRPRWKGAGRDAQGLRCYLLDAGRLVHRRSWHQGHEEAERGAALTPVKVAGWSPEDQGRLGGGGAGASWRWQHVQSVFPEACPVLDSAHCKEDLSQVAQAH
jgi:hypothetical protein